MSDLVSSQIRELREGFKPSSESGLILWPCTIRGLMKRLKTIEEMALETEAELLIADKRVTELQRQLHLHLHLLEQHRLAPPRDNVVLLRAPRPAPTPNGGGDAA